MGRKKKEIKAEDKKIVKSTANSQFDLIRMDLENTHGADFFAPNVETFSFFDTGSILLNFSLDTKGRGFRSSTSMSISGEPKLGKTSSLLFLAGLAQSQNNYFVCVVDFELRNDKQKCQDYGIDISPNKFALIRPNDLESGVSAINKYLASGANLFILLDSLDAMTSGVIKSIDWNNPDEMRAMNTAGLRRAGLVTNFINAVNAKIRKSNSILCYTQQMRTKMGPAFSYRGESGASAGDFNVDYKIRLTADKKEDIVFGGKIVGRMLEFDFRFNAMNAPNICEKIPFIYQRGFWKEMELTILGVRLGILEKDGSKKEDGKVRYKKDGKIILERKDQKNFAAYLTNKEKDPSIDAIKKEIYDLVMLGMKNQAEEKSTLE